MIDVGSGAGFPGLPLKIIRPELTMYLLEPTGKKAAFLRHMVTTLSLMDVKVVQGRLEDASTLMQGTKFDAAVVRSLFSIGDFVAKAADVVKSGGVMILSKGRDYKKELWGINSEDLCIREITIPATDIQRFIIVAIKGC